jgi:hypothetical protein
MVNLMPYELAKMAGLSIRTDGKHTLSGVNGHEQLAGVVEKCMIKIGGLAVEHHIFVQPKTRAMDCVILGLPFIHSCAASFKYHHDGRTSLKLKLEGKRLRVEMAKTPMLYQLVHMEAPAAAKHTQCSKSGLPGKRSEGQEVEEELRRSSTNLSQF